MALNFSDWLSLRYSQRETDLGLPGWWDSDDYDGEPGWIKGEALDGLQQSFDAKYGRIDASGREVYGDAGFFPGVSPGSVTRNGQEWIRIGDAPDMFHPYGRELIAQTGVDVMYDESLGYLWRQDLAQKVNDRILSERGGVQKFLDSGGGVALVSAAFAAAALSAGAVGAASAAEGAGASSFSGAWAAPAAPELGSGAYGLAASASSDLALSSSLIPGSAMGYTGAAAGVGAGGFSVANVLSSAKSAIDFVGGLGKTAATVAALGGAAGAAGGGGAGGFLPMPGFTLGLSAPGASGGAAAGFPGMTSTAAPGASAGSGDVLMVGGLLAALAVGAYVVLRKRRKR